MASNSDWRDVRVSRRFIRDAVRCFPGFKKYNSLVRFNNAKNKGLIKKYDSIRIKRYNYSFLNGYFYDGNSHVKSYYDLDWFFKDDRSTVSLVEFIREY